MPSLKIHHIGYLVKKLEKAKTTFESLGYLVEQDTVRDEIRKVDICFLIKDGYRVELVSPFSEESVVSGLMKKYKNAPRSLPNRILFLNPLLTESSYFFLLNLLKVEYSVLPAPAIATVIHTPG